MENSVVVLTNLKYTNIWTFSYLFLFGKQEYSNYKKKDSNVYSSPKLTQENIIDNGFRL